MACFFVFVVRSSGFGSEMEEKSDIIVKVADGVVSGVKNRSGFLVNAADAICKMIAPKQPEPLAKSPQELRVPQPGEWWGHPDGSRFYCAGFHQNSNEHVVLRDRDTNYKVVRFSGSLIDAGWRYLPLCDCFSWIDPSLPPSKTLKEISGTWPTCEKQEQEIPTKSPQEQIDSLIGELEQKMINHADVAYNPIPDEIVEEPVAYVVQNRATVSEWRDQIHWSTWPIGHWEKATDDFKEMMHGCKRGSAVLSVRCKESELPDLHPMMLNRDIRPYEELPSVSEAAFPSNQQLFEALANLRDQMDAMNKRTSELHARSTCVSLRVPSSGDARTDHLIRTSVRRDIAVAFASGSLAFSPGMFGRSDWQDSNQLADLPKAAVTFADDLMKQLGFSE